jgi:RNA polymerase sigma-70 factor (ECF subfamily)
LIKEQEQIETILEGCRNDDRRAQEQLYRNYYKAMANLCMRYTKNEADAKEALNTGFYKVFKNIHRFDNSRASFYTWISTIIVNTCLSSIRAREKRKTVLYELDNEDTHSIEPEVIAKFRSNELLNLLRELPDMSQATFSLFVIEGYSHKEIAAMLGVSEGTSKWYLSEARKQLQSLLK